MHHRVIISLASNIDHRSNLQKARTCLGGLLPSCQYTRELWTEPIATGSGTRTARRLYLNQLVSATYTGDAAELKIKLKQIETQLGRTPQDKLQGIVTIDLDLLQFDNERFHLKDWERPYVKDLLPELP